MSGGFCAAVTHPMWMAHERPLEPDLGWCQHTGWSEATVLAPRRGMRLNGKGTGRAMGSAVIVLVRAEWRRRAGALVALALLCGGGGCGGARGVRRSAAYRQQS